MTDSESDGAGYLSEDNHESGFLDGPRDSAALAASSYTRLPQGMTMTPKIPPGFDGIMSWFEYEQLVDDWVALTTIEPARQGPSLKTRLSGIAEKYKELLDNERLRDPDQGVEYFKRFLRPYFVKGVQHVYLYRFLQLFKTWRGSKDYVTWITDFEIMLKKGQKRLDGFIANGRHNGPAIYIHSTTRTRVLASGNTASTTRCARIPVRQVYGSSHTRTYAIFSHWGQLASTAILGPSRPVREPA